MKFLSILLMQGALSLLNANAGNATKASNATLNNATANDTAVDLMSDDFRGSRRKDFLSFIENAGDDIENAAEDVGNAIAKNPVSNQVMNLAFPGTTTVVEGVATVGDEKKCDRGDQRACNDLKSV